MTNASLEYAPLQVAIEHVTTEHHEARCSVNDCGEWADHRDAAREDLGLDSDSVDDWPIIVGSEGVACGRCFGIVGLGHISLRELVDLLCLHLAYKCTDERLAKALASRRT